MGSAIMLWVLAWLGYSANEAQSGSSLNGINLLQTIIPGLFAIFAVFCLRFYQLDSKQIKKIQSDQQTRDEQPAYSIDNKNEKKDYQPERRIGGA